MSYEFKGTKGEWLLSEFTDNSVHFIYSEGCGNKGDIVCNPPTEEEEESLTMWKYNQHIIAAAPNLFEELININKVLDEMWNDTNRESKKAYYEKKICAAQAQSAKAIHKALNIKP